MCIKKCDPDHRKCKFPTGFHWVSKCMHVMWYIYVHGLATIIDELLMSFGNYLFLDLFGVYIVTTVHYYINHGSLRKLATEFHQVKEWRIRSQM